MGHLRLIRPTRATPLPRWIHPTSAAAPHLRSNPAGAAQQGFGLTEILLVAGLAILSVGAGYGLYTQSQAKQELTQANQSMSALAQGITRVYGTSGSYSGLNAPGAIADGAVPNNLVIDPATGTPLSGLGGHIALQPETVNISNDAFSLTYDSLSASSCSGLAANAGAATQILINGQVATKTDPGSLAAMCTSTSNTAKFILGGAGNAMAATGGTGGTGTACVAPAPQTQAVACPAGQISSVAPGYSPNGITQQRDASCPDPYGTPQWGSWYQTGSTCVPICVASAPQTQAVACPAGQEQSVSPYGPNGITQQRDASCTTPIGPMVWGAWYQTASTCAPICSAPPSGTGSQGASCPAGQVTSSGASSFTQTRTITYSCPAPTGAYATAYGAWAPLATAVCAPQCVAPGPGSQSQTASCPGGQVTPGGASTFTQTRSVTYSCPAPQGAYATAYGAWSPTAGSACAPQCTVPAPNYTTAPCPAGYNGVVNERQDASCPSPTGAVAWGGWYQTGNTCVLATPPPATYSGGQVCATFGVNVPGGCAPGAGVSVFVSGGFQVWTGGSYTITINYNGSSQAVTAYGGMYPQSTNFTVGGGTFVVTVNAQITNNCPAANPAFAGSCIDRVSGSVSGP
jgi:type II secretory pathway pseudopilin PulG